MQPGACRQPAWAQRIRAAALAPGRRIGLGLALLLAGVPRPAGADGPSTTVPFTSLGLRAWEQRDRMSADPRVRASVAYRIGHYAPRAADGSTRQFDQDLADLIGTSPELVVRLAAVSALAERGTPQARDALTLVAAGLTRTTVGRRPSGVVQTEVQSAALRALRAYRLETRQFTGLLESMLQGQTVSNDVLDATAELLAAQPDEVYNTVLNAGVGNIPRNRMIARAIALRGDPRSYPRALHGRLQSQTPAVVQEAANAAARLHATEAVSDLVELLQHTQDAESRRAMVRALGSLGGGNPAVVRAALADAATRAAGLDACGRMGDASLVPDVARLLAAPWAADRRDAAEALGAIGGGAAAASIAVRLGAEQDESVRAALWHALARTGGGAAREAVARGAAIEPAARWALLEAVLREGGAGSGQGAPAGLRDAVMRGDASALVLAGALGVDRVELLAALRGSDAGARAAAALGFSLAGASGEEVERALEAMLAREDAEGARVSAVAALARSGGALARETLLALVEREEGEPTLAGLAAAAAAADLGLPVRASLVAMLNDPRSLVRAVAARSLGRLGPGEGASGLEYLVRFDPEASVRAAAARSLAECAGEDGVDALEALERAAWTASLAQAARDALAVAQGDAPVQRFGGSAVARVSGAPPGSVWGAWLPDGSLRFASAAPDGELVVPGVAAGDGSAGGRPSQGTLLVRLDQP